MAYAIDKSLSYVSNDNPNKVVANISFQGKGMRDALRFLNENDFFAIDPDIVKNVNLEQIEFEIVFHFDLDNMAIFELDVCDVIDCSKVEGGKIVLSCERYCLRDRITPQATAETKPVSKQNEKQEDDESGQEQGHKETRHSIFDLINSVFDGYTLFDSMFNLPKMEFPDITKMIDDSRSRVQNAINDAKKDNEGKFYEFSCRIDPNGKMKVVRKSNEGTVTKEYDLNLASGKTEPSKKIEIKDENGGHRENTLADLIK
jgi:hypothetical protein